MLSVARKIFGSVNDRKLKPLRARVNRINALEPMMEALSDEALKGKTEEFRKRLADGGGGQTLGDGPPGAPAGDRGCLQREANTN